MFDTAELDGPSRGLRSLLVDVYAADGVHHSLVIDTHGGSLHAALGIDHEGPGDDDALLVHEPPRYLHEAAPAPSRLDAAGLEGSVALVHEDDLPEARVHDGVHGHGDARLVLHRELDIDEHVRLQHDLRIIHLETDLERPRRQIEL